MKISYNEPPKEKTLLKDAWTKFGVGINHPVFVNIISSEFSEQSKFAILLVAPTGDKYYIRPTARGWAQMDISGLICYGNCEVELITAPFTITP